MKLYEFTVRDNLNLLESEILERVRVALETEAETQGWAGDYTFDQRQSPKQLPTGGKEYFFAVTGSYLDGANDSSDEELAQRPDPSRERIAARPIEL